MAIITPPLGGLSMGPLKILFGASTNPNSGPDSNGGDLAGCGVGSLYLGQSDGSLWSKVGPATGANPLGTWISRA